MATLAEILALLPDNTTGQIDASDMRTAVTALWERTPSSGTTAQRPLVVQAGFTYYDTTITAPVWWDGAAWVDSTGAPA